MKNNRKLDKLLCEMLLLNFRRMLQHGKERRKKMISFGRACRDPESHAVFAIVISGSNLPLFSADRTGLSTFLTILLVFLCSEWQV
jgi:hypothetical protein